jgi:predicted tellurium resistance membrane protein TerC
VALGFAWLCYLCAIACIVAVPWLLGDLGGDHPIVASLAAASVFFVGAGIVLHVIGRADLPSLKPGRGPRP